MRVISGSAKKTLLKMPGGGKVRPTADRVKEALFNILGPLVIDAGVLDLFAGSGALGIEALSRGGDYCVFVEKDSRVIGTLKENLQRAKLWPKAKIVNQDVRNALKFLSGKGCSFDLVFMDPPWRQGLELAVLEQVSDLKIVKSGGVVIVESHKEQLFPDKISFLEKVRYYKYGDTVLTFFKIANLM